VSKAALAWAQRGASLVRPFFGSVNVRVFVLNCSRTSMPVPQWVVIGSVGPRFS
jgi:hypothetical protein